MEGYLDRFTRHPCCSVSWPIVFDTVRTVSVFPLPKKIERHHDSLSERSSAVAFERLRIPTIDGGEIGARLNRTEGDDGELNALCRHGIANKLLFELDQ